MRVLIVNRMLGTLLGGGETFDLAVARNLAKLSHNVTLVTAKPLFSCPILSYPDLKVVYLSTLDLRPLEARGRRVKQTLGAVFRYIDSYVFERAVFSWLSRNGRYGKYDIVQCCSMFWLPKWILTHFKTPVVSWLPGPPSRLTQRLIRTLVSYPHFGLFTHGDPVEVLENHLGFMQGVEFKVIEPGVDLALAEFYDSQREIIRSDLGISNDTVVGVTVARLIPIKNTPFLLQGLRRAISELKMPIIWFMVGEGPERAYLEQLAVAKGLEGYIRWFGQMPQDKVHQILAASDIFALTSTYESFSIAILEAMAHKLPVVATKVGYLETIVQESDGGILVNSGDVDGLAQAIVRLANDMDYRRQLGEKGWTYVQRFNWPNIIVKLLRLYERVIAGRLTPESRPSSGSKTLQFRSQRG